MGVMVKNSGTFFNGVELLAYIFAVGSTVWIYLRANFCGGSKNASFLQ